MAQALPAPPWTRWSTRRARASRSSTTTFADKEPLVAAVIKFQVAQVLEFQEPYLERLASVADLRRWRDAVVWFVEEARGRQRVRCRFAVRELADRSEPARILIQSAFRSGESYLAAGLRRMQDRGELDAGPDPGELAVGLMAAYQGRLPALPVGPQLASDGDGGGPRARQHRSSAGARRSRAGAAS